MEIGFRLRAYSIDDIKVLVDALVRLDVNQLKRHRYPSIYKSGVRYRREGVGREQWQTIEDMLESGFGDCEDFAAWRCAELRMLGIRAQPWFSKRGKTWHVYVKYPDGKTEDPSEKLGMKNPYK